jgi:hypothetical protein
VAWACQQLIAPFLGFAWVARGLAELHQALDGLGQPNLGRRRDLLLALLHALIALHKQRLGLGVLPLTHERFAQRRALVEGGLF